MKLESLVIVNQHVTVNDLSNFAHTAHHARRVVSAGHLLNYMYVCRFSKSVKVGGGEPTALHAERYKYLHSLLFIGTHI